MSWTPEMVADTRGPELAHRCYLEHHQLRQVLAGVLGDRRCRAAADVGAGYGRMTPVLAEWADTVVGFEREPQLREIATMLQPAPRWTAIDDLATLPAADSSFDLVLVFTVLQHLSDDDACRVCAELHRVLAADGVAVLVEETDTTLCAGDPTQSGSCTVGRPVSFYADAMAPWTCVSTTRRRVEASYEREDVGTFMCFQRR